MKFRYKIEYYDLKYPYIKYILLAIIAYALLSKHINFYYIISTLLILLISIISHELAHGYVAYLFKDDTAKKMGRLSINPMRHIDLYGLILPFTLILIGSPIIFGSAKPVPIDYNKLKPRKLGIFLVSVSGVLVNLILAILAIIILKYTKIEVFYRMAVTNVVLAVFNIMPIPPLDGSRVLRLFLSYENKKFLDYIEYNPFISIFLVIMLINSNFFIKLINFVFNLIIRII